MELSALIVLTLVSCALAWDEEPLWDLTDISAAQILALALASSAVLLDLRSRAFSGAYAPLDRLAAAAATMWSTSMGVYSILIFCVLAAHLLAPAMAAHQDPSLAYASRLGRYGAWPVWASLALAALALAGPGWARFGARAAALGTWALTWALASAEVATYSAAPSHPTTPTLAATGYWGEGPGAYDWAGSVALPHPLLFEDELLFSALVIFLAIQSLLGLVLVALFLGHRRSSSDGAFALKVTEASAQALILALALGSTSALRLRVGLPT